MACLMVPATGAVVSKLVSKHCENKGKVSFARKLGWLTKLMTGGSVLLAFEHLWHEEILFHTPFLTAMENSADKAAAIHEMATTGVAMLLVCVAVWCVMLAVSAAIEKQAVKNS